ncbi:F-box/FBD/LRR-repeat protein At1g13570 isoform X1 [Cryptomeria japonica]|uniref:F-box/FBD/LRR-repeat protein At1g13570 isoform X1 n=1 Tax=Cryptomeria japonica TaxID=3369 RepID=UPI0027DAB4B1|nr:F-box/FBD/LRR-repeat protein At1g13570 isoform X1 [Cryptomeria japonica]XP_059069137.1 F-box/FBD/LRR-repeat protein At1g13570 isoform X1 [Cryptomeria japonica]
MSAPDAFCILPDSLVAFILSKMTITDAVKSSILSKRWRFVYTQMPQITFYPHHFLRPGVTPRDPCPVLGSRVGNIISNILLGHSHNLEGLHLHSSDSDWLNFSDENVCKWVRHASQCNVQHLTLRNHNNIIDRTTYPPAVDPIPPPALFKCSRLVTFYLDKYNLTRFPIDFVGFPNLNTCHLRYVKFTDESLVSLISLCPCLQKLEIILDNWLGNVIIFSSTLEHLNISFVKSLSVNCPKFRNLSAAWIDDLSVNGVPFYELSMNDTFHLEMHCGGTLRELNMNCLGGILAPLPGVVSASRFLHIVGNFQSLKKLVINLTYPWKMLESEAGMDVPLLDLLHRLPNLQTLSMLGFFVEELARGPIPDCLTSPHVNLKKIRLQIIQFDDKEVAVISCLLQSMPSLEAFEIKLPYECDENESEYEGQCLKLFKDIMSLRRASSLARIIVLDKCSK